jgi:hypothetical protein
MLVDMVESLMSRNDMYFQALASAKKFWDKFFEDIDDYNEEKLQEKIDKAQIPFQWQMEKDAGMTPPLSKSIMALTAIGSLYSDGFEDKDLARRVVDCFIKSNNLSIDVKSAAKKVKNMYGLK